MKGIDCTNVITEQIGKQLKNSGIEFVCRYLVPQRLAWKRLLPSEVEILTKLGICVVSVFETTTDRAKGGATAGVLDASEAKKEALNVAQPKNSAIYFAVDYEATETDFDKIEAYLKAASKEIPEYNVGVYGSYSVVEEMAKRKACKHFWQTYAWSKGSISKFANIHQYKNGVTMAGIQCDLNDSYGNEGAWNHIPDLNWKDILKITAYSPDEWEKAIQTASNVAKADGNLGDLEIFKYLPELIEKIYKACL